MTAQNKCYDFVLLYTEKLVATWNKDWTEAYFINLLRLQKFYEVGLTIICWNFTQKR